MSPQDFQRAGEIMLDTIAGLARHLPADRLDWAPAETVMSLGQVAYHAASSFTPLVQFVVGGDGGFSAAEMERFLSGATLHPPGDVDLAAIVAEHRAKLAEIMAPVTLERWLHETKELPWGFTGSVGHCCVYMLEHSAGHRYQLFLYLKLLGLPLTTRDLYGLT